MQVEMKAGAGEAVGNGEIATKSPGMIDDTASGEVL
jgi:hypothetical protein